MASTSRNLPSCESCHQKAKKNVMEDLSADTELQHMLDDLLTCGEEVTVMDIVGLLERMDTSDNPPKPKGQSQAEPKIPKPQIRVHPMADKYMEAMKDTLHDFFYVKKRAPTTKSLWRSLKENTKYRGSTKDLRKLMEQSGYSVQLHNRKKHRSKLHAKCLAILTVPSTSSTE